MQLNDNTRYGGIYLDVPDIDRYYDTVADKAIIVNDIDARNPAEMDRLNRLLYTQFEGDLLDTTPSCDCGKFRGEHLVGTVCRPDPHNGFPSNESYCYTEVASITERPMESILWIRTPPGIKRLIVPQVWTVLSDFFKTNNVIRWLCDPTYHIEDKATKNRLQRILDLGWKRNINHFVDNFDWIMDYLISHKFGEAKKPLQRHYITLYINQHKHKFFPRHLPIPNRSVFIIEKTPLGTWTDPTLSFGLDAVRTICSIEHSYVPLSTKQIENATIKAIWQLADYYDSYVTRNISKKPGMARRQMVGGRLDFSARAVISSLSGRHYYQELHIPWGVAVMMLKSHITSKLDKRGYTPRQCEELISLYTKRYHPVLDEVMKELIDESPYKALPCILQRNPTLTRGSAQLLYITKIETDTTINTFAMSVLVLKGPNADYDGDELNLELLLDKTEHDAFYVLSPHYYVLDTQQPKRISSFMAIPEPVLQTISSFVHEYD